MEEQREKEKEEEDEEVEEEGGRRWGEEPTSTHVTEAGEEEGEEEVEDDEVTHKDGGHEVGDAGFATGGEEGVGLKTVTDAQLQTDSYRWGTVTVHPHQWDTHSYMTVKS